MKKYLLLSFCLFSAFLSGQSDFYPSWVVGGRASYSTVDDNFSRENRVLYSFSPYIAKELSARWIVGVRMLANGSPYFASISSAPFVLMTDEREIGAGLWARYTFNPANTLQFYASPYFNVLNGEIYDLGNDRENVGDTGSRQLGLDLGFTYLVNNRWRFLLRLGGVDFTSREEDSRIFGSRKSDAFNIGFGLASLGLGLEYRF